MVRHWLVAGMLVVIGGAVLATNGGGERDAPAAQWSLGGVTVAFDGTTPDTSHGPITVPHGGEGIVAMWRQLGMSGAPPAPGQGRLALFVPLESSCSARDIDDITVVETSPVRQTVEVIVSPGCVPEVDDEVVPAVPRPGSSRSLVVLHLPWESEQQPDPVITGRP